MKANASICEVCLSNTTGDPCSRHPYAQLLDPSIPADQDWLQSLHQVRKNRRRRVVAAVLTLLWFALVVMDISMVLSGIGALGLGTMVVVELFMMRSNARASQTPDRLLDADTVMASPTEACQERRQRRESLTSGRRPSAGRINVAG